MKQKKRGRRGTPLRRRGKSKYEGKFSPRMQGTLLTVFAVIIVAFFALLIIVGNLTRENGDRYGKRVLSQQTYVSNVIEYKRGDILDRNNTKLATSQLLYNVVVSPKELIEDEECGDATIKAVCSYFDLEESELHSNVSERSSSQYYVVAKNVSKSDKDAYDEMVEKEKKRSKEEKDDMRINANAVYFEKIYKRNYPLNDTACSVIGFSSANNDGLWGLEYQYNDELNGVTGRSYGYYSSDSTLEKNVKDAQDGNTIVTTLDVNIQSIVESKIDKFMKKTGAKNVGCVVMNPKNGEIYAMSSDVRYDLNNAFDLTQIYAKSEVASMTEEEKSDALNDMWSNWCIGYSFEPGSTYKPLTVAAALEEGIAKNNQCFDCDGGEDIFGTWISCVSKFGHGSLTLEESLMESCNDVMMQLSSRMKKTKFLEYQKRFNIGYKTGIDLPGENSGTVFTEDRLGPTELATSSFGQGFSVNMIQIASAFSSVINGGNYYKPHLIKQILDENGNLVENIEPTLVRKTVSESTSELLRQYLLNTVEAGTGNTAAVAGYSIGGKTGTAEKFPRPLKNYLVSFIGAAPMDDPEVVVYVIVDEPNVEDQAHSTYAQEVVRNIMKEILPFLGVYKDESAGNNQKGSEDAEETISLEGVSTDTSIAKNTGWDKEKEEEADNAEIEDYENVEGSQEPFATKEAESTNEPVSSESQEPIGEGTE